MWTLVVASNSNIVLYNNLLCGFETTNANTLIVKNPKSASSAYNYGIDKLKNEIIVFAHQDVFLPPNWAKSMISAIDRLTINDPEWGVVGLYGVKSSGIGAGFVYSTGLRRFVGDPFYEPIEVRTLDELLLVIRKSSGLRFDERLPGFHLYGTDICMEAERRGLKNYVISCFALHNSVGLNFLPRSFWKAYLYLRKKWRDRLPIITPCTRITRSCSPIVESFGTKLFSTVIQKNAPGSRVADPDKFFKEQLAKKIL